MGYNYFSQPLMDSLDKSFFGKESVIIGSLSLLHRKRKRSFDELSRRGAGSGSGNGSRASAEAGDGAVAAAMACATVGFD
ncbi:hypothetical protein NC651_015465 [Populus alba x Populus x berolinensis]|nr:hypothetical protein NC651_015465 [Populus alba x Populus x berolinensis]